MPDAIYYGHMDKVEVSGSNYYYEFHCLLQSFADNILALQLRDFFNAVRENKDQVITLENTSIAVNKIYFGQKDLADSESDWVIINTNRDKIGVPALLFGDYNDEINELHISSITPFDPNSVTLKNLTNKVSLDDFTQATQEELLDALNRSKHETPEFVGVYNVGQGNCNAICNSGSAPLLYFDLGGGCYTNKSSYPTVLRFCFTSGPWILLSHWDTDHFQSAKMNTVYLSKNWIVPYQTIGPVHLKFFLSISPTPLIWPTTITSLSFCWGTVWRCNGPIGKKNHTGLALAVKINPSLNSIKDVLLPADAAYHYISGSSASFDGLTATHHGAEFYNGNAPLPGHKGKAANCYSYGVFNSYGHPKSLALGAHRGAGWVSAMQKDTVTGHIALADNPTTLLLTCRGNNCDLAIAQQY